MSDVTEEQIEQFQKQREEANLPLEKDRKGYSYLTSMPSPYKEVETLTLFQCKPFFPYLHFSEVSKNKSGGKLIYINLFKGSLSGLNLQLLSLDEKPLRSPFGASFPKKKEGESEEEAKKIDKNRPSLSFVIDDSRIVDAFKDFDASIKAHVIAEKDTIFSKPIKADILEYTHTPSLTASKPKEVNGILKNYSPILSVKLTLQGPNATRVFISQGRDDSGMMTIKRVRPEDVTMDLFGKGVEAYPIIKISSIWFMGSSDYGTAKNCSDIILMPRSSGNKPGNFSGNFQIVEGDVDTLQEPTPLSPSMDEEDHSYDDSTHYS